MLNMIFDSHAHYDDDAFNDDRDILLSSMNKNNVGMIVNVGASMQSTVNSIELAKKYSFIYATVGVHPNETSDLNEDDFKTLERLSNEKKVVAIGEIGLDYHFLEPGKERQIECFKKQLEIAVKTKLPIIIHSRDAASDTMDILKEYQPRLNGGVIHCYSYSQEIALEYLKMGYYIGIGGVLTFKNAKKLKEVAAITPLDRIVLETDCPYMAPAPNRGTRNNSINLKYVAQELANIKEIDVEQVYETTYNNAKKLYNIND